VGIAAAEHVARHPDGSLAAAARTDPEGADARLVLERAAAGDEEAVALLTEVGSTLGTGLVSLAHAFEPELFVIGGGFGEAARDWILEPARRVLREQAMHPMASIGVVAARLGGDAGMLGAAELPRVG
jgi:glucokinase